MSEKKFKNHLDKLVQKNYTKDYYARFKFKSLKYGQVKLQLNILEGEQNAPCIVFMPGTNMYSMLYAEFLIALNDAGYHVLAFDPRSHGRSSGKKGSYVIEELLSDMDEVVNYVRKNISKNIFVSGSSQGGIVAFYYAAAHESLVKGAICHNLADLADEDSLQIARYPKLAKALKPLIVNFSDVMPELPIWLTWYLNLKKEVVKGWGNGKKLIQENEYIAPYVRLKTISSLMTTPLIRPIEQIKTPIYILHGSEDGIFPYEYIEGLYNRLPGEKRMKVHEGQHHFLIINAVEKIVPDVIDWIKKLDRKTIRPAMAISW